MTEADIPALVAIEAQSFYDAWNENMLRNEIANELTTYLVMECAGKLVGYAGFWLEAGEEQITRVAVADEELYLKHIRRCRRIERYKSRGWPYPSKQYNTGEN